MEKGSRPFSGEGKEMGDVCMQVMEYLEQSFCFITKMTSGMSICLGQNSGTIMSASILLSSNALMNIMFTGI